MLYIDPGQPDWPPALTEYEAEALNFCQAWQRGQPEFVLHTSGSTGTPKPITLSRRQMQASARLTGLLFGLEPGDPILVCLNVRYIAGIMMLVRGLELKLPMTLIEPVSNPLAAFVPITRFAFLALVPLQLQTILEQNNPAQLSTLNGAKAILVGGAATGPALEQALQVIDAPVFATYGMTETVSHIAIRRLNGPDATEQFTALAEVNLGLDERDCLNIQSAATDFVRIQTNDVAELLPGNRFRLLGRADQVINSGGVKIQPEQVERVIQQALSQQSLSRPAPRLFVAGVADERLGQRVVAYLENYTLNRAQWGMIADRISAELGPYAVPKELHTVPKFAETPTSKIDKLATMGVKS